MEKGTRAEILCPQKASRVSVKQLCRHFKVQFRALTDGSVEIKPLAQLNSSLYGIATKFLLIAKILLILKIGRNKA